MVQGDKYDDFTVSETGNWNVADKYTKIKIMLPMAKCEFYEDLAQFGYESFIDELVNWYNIPMDVLRIKGLTRLIKELLRLCDNCMFAMRKAGSKDELVKYQTQLKAIEKILPALSKMKFNQVKKTKQVVLIPEKFDPVLQRVIDLKAKINEPLNKNDLIFTNREEFDPKKFKKDIMDRMTTKS